MTRVGLVLCPSITPKAPNKEPTGLSNLAVSQAHHQCLCNDNSWRSTASPFYILDSSEKFEDNFRVKVEWLVGLPSVSGQYGCPTFQEDCDSFFAMQTCSLVDNSLLNETLRYYLSTLPEHHACTKLQ